MGNRGYVKLPTTEPVVEKAPGDEAVHFKKMVVHAACYGLLVVSNLICVILWLREQSIPCIRPQLVYSPARDVISYEKRRLMRNINGNPYTGEPREEHDKAWARLIEPMTIKISQEELDMLGETSVAFRDGSGFIGELAVYHELHCVKRIRRHLQLDYYYPNMTAEERRKEDVHIDHCLEYWREAAMCRGDATISTFGWGAELVYSTVYSDHECVNWASFDGWARSRMVDMSDYSVLEAHSNEE